MDTYRKSIDNIEEYWEQEARKLEWFSTWDHVLDWDAPFAKWFSGGMLNASYLCVDKHLKNWRRNKVAIYWVGEDGEEKGEEGKDPDPPHPPRDPHDPGT